jgi:RNA polymerase sigma-70 factor, ECF subfamily
MLARVPDTNEVMSDDTRFERLFREHVAAVRAYVGRRDAGLADEVVAETFLICWRRLDDVPRDELPWLLGVARRTLANAWRARDRQAALVERVTALPDPADAQGESDPRVAAALETLSPRDREVLLLVAWDGLDRGGIARVLGCTRGEVGVRLHRARRRFAAAYGECETTPPNHVLGTDEGVSHV